MRNTIIGLLAAGTVSLVAVQTTPVKNTWSDIQGFGQDSTKLKKKSTQVHVSSNGKHSTTYSDDHTREEITYGGTIRISKDFTDIESISPRGSLTYVNTTNDETRRFEIKSDNEGKLTRIYNQLNAPQYQELFTVITTIGSDYEKGKVLQGLAPAIPSNAKVLREGYQKTANSIGSDYERRRTFDALK